MPELYTIGHSTHSWESLLGLLRKHGITAVADVRSVPYSVRLPQFNREALERSLGDARIKYVFLGKELGARRQERDCYLGGMARYDLIAQCPLFRAGLERLRTGSGHHRIALFCAEKDPLECHRTILICRKLRHEMEIRHILADGELEPHESAEERLLAEEKVPDVDLFIPRQSLIDRAFEQRAEKIAFQEQESAEPASRG